MIKININIKMINCKKMIKIILKNTNFIINLISNKILILVMSIHVRFKVFKTIYAFAIYFFIICFCK